ncbi:MAG: hypothetical protein K8S23_05270 [Candidatus Cloacimonetes bacterium]|nr:hypothetical protein [Candidatus Cloacimonadota bacterium]
MRVKNGTKYFIIIFIIATSIFLGVKRSKIHKSFSTKTIIVNDEKEIQKFNTAPNYQKIKLTYNIQDFQVEKKKFETILTKYSKKIETSKSENYILVVAEIPDSLTSEMLMELREIKGLTGDDTNNYEPQDININITEHLANKKLVKKRITQDLENTGKHLSEDRISRMGKKLTILQTEIDSLNNQVNIQKRNSENNLIFIKAVRMNTENLLLTSTKTFVLTTLIVLVLLSIGFVFFYYVMIFFLKMMKRIGLRTTSSGKSSYNYNKYYGYGRKNRKIKRVYKDKTPEDK